MKTNIWKIGGRTRKTVLAVFLCFLIDTIRKDGVPFYAAIAAILCIQHNLKDSFSVALTREIATIIGGVFGMTILTVEKGIYRIPNDLLRYLFLSVLLIPIINFSVWIKQEKGTFLMCVVFLCITTTHGTDENPLTFGIARIIDTTIGIIIALLINKYPSRESRKITKSSEPINGKMNVASRRR